MSARQITLDAAQRLGLETAIAQQQQANALVAEMVQAIAGRVKPDVKYEAGVLTVEDEDE